MFWLLKAYAEERAGGKLADGNIDYAFFADFKDWLFTAPRRHSINYAAKVVDVLKQFMREAQRRGYHTTTVTRGLPLKKSKRPE